MWRPREEPANIPIILIDHTNNPYGSAFPCLHLENNVSVGRIAAEEQFTQSASASHLAHFSFDYRAIQDRQLRVEKEKAVAGREMA